MTKKKSKNEAQKSIVREILKHFKRLNKGKPFVDDVVKLFPAVLATTKLERCAWCQSVPELNIEEDENYFLRFRGGEKYTGGDRYNLHLRCTVCGDGVDYLYFTPLPESITGLPGTIHSLLNSWNTAQDMLLDFMEETVRNSVTSTSIEDIIDILTNLLERNKEGVLGPTVPVSIYDRLEQRHIIRSGGDD